MKKNWILFIAVSAFAITNITFGQEQSGRNSVVKFSPTKMMRGEILFSYERKMTEQASFEFSAGPALSNVFPINFDHLFNSSSAASETSLFGFALSGSARYYPLEDKDALEGFYVAPLIGFTQLNYEFSATNLGIPNVNLANQRGHSNQTSFAFLFGTQKWLSSSFCIDMFIGSGIKQVSEDNYTVQYIQDPITYQYKGAQWVGSKISDTRWFFTGGIKFGVGFGKKK